MSEAAPRILTPEYYERLKAVEEQHPWALAMRRLALALLRRCLNGVRQPKLLDAGCGAGLFLSKCAAELAGAELAGFDLSLYGLRAARKHGLRRLAAANSCDLPFPSGEFHVVVCQDVMQHLTAAEARQSLEEFTRVLRPDGWLLVRTAARRGLGRKKHLDSAGYRQWEPEVLAATLAEHGFEVEFLARVNWLPGLLADLRAYRSPRPQGDVGLSLDPQGGRGWQGRLLTAYWALERRLVLGTGWRPGRGHTLFCLAKKTARSRDAGLVPRRL
jgi:2-polyprenyl-3-methyl-5-hydroxy-6-metoxy-1,4-benzoquinol methylase